MNVFTWYWRQDHRPIQYRPEHVQKLQSMVKRHLRIPHQFICITDLDVPNVACIPPLPEMERVKNKRWGPHQPQCYRRLRMFDPEMRDILGERYVQIDLDTVIVDDITPMFDRSDPLVINRSIGRRDAYNGSMWLHTPGTHASLYAAFDPDQAIAASKRGYVGSDQAWMRYHLGDGAVPTWSKSDGSFQYRSFRREPDTLPDGARIVFFAGQAKPWNLEHDWVREHYC